MEKIQNMDMQLFHAGAARVNITPDLGTLINGDFLPHKAKYIHDDLYVRALMLQKAETIVTIVLVDTCAMSMEYTSEIKAEIGKHLGIDPGNILIACTHTHAGGAVIDIHLCPSDTFYSERLQPLIVEAVRQAKENLRPAKVAFGSFNMPEHVNCRRYHMKDGYVARNPVSGETDIVKTNPFGSEDKIEKAVALTDPGIAYLAIQDNNGKWISILGNYSLHYVGDWENGTISSDYFGEFAKQLHNSLGADDDFVGIMSNGTSGDVNSWDFLHPGRYPAEHFQKSKLIAGEIVQKLISSLEKIEWELNPGLSIQYVELLITTRKPSIKEVETAKAIVAATDYDSTSIDEEGLEKIYAREQILLNEYPDKLSFPVQVIQVGKNLIGALGGELFAETGLWLKKNSRGKNYFTIGLANGNRGYVPPEHEIEKGGYETWRCRASCLEPKAENTIRNKLLEMINQFK